MAWTTPKVDWETGELVAASDLNAMGSNDSYLKDRIEGAAKQYIKPSGNYLTTSTSYVDMDAVNMSHTITTTGGNVRITFAGEGYVSGGANLLYIGIEIDETDYLIFRVESTNNNDYHNLSFSYIVTGLAAGEHTFNMRWYVSTGTGGISGKPQFDVREDVGVVA